jgi:hypothetical protein
VSLSRFTHAACEGCWGREKGYKEPQRVRRPEMERCCFCGNTTLSGIYTREAPEKLTCKGIYGVHEETKR